MADKYELADEIAELFKSAIYYYRDTQNVERIGRGSRLLGYPDLTNEVIYRGFPDRLLMIEGASGCSDVGGLVNLANYEYLLEEWGEWEAENGHPVTVFVRGAYGSYGILVNLDAASLEQLQEVKSVLRYLERNPILSDNVYHELEAERIEDALNSVAISSFYSGLLDRLYDTQFGLADLDYNRDVLRELFKAIFAEMNGQYIVEGQGITLSIDPKEVAKKADLHLYPQFWLLVCDFDKINLPVQDFSPVQMWFPLDMFGFYPEAMFNVVFEELLPQQESD